MAVADGIQQVPATYARKLSLGVTATVERIKINQIRPYMHTDSFYSKWRERDRKVDTYRAPTPTIKQESLHRMKQKDVSV